MYHTFLSSGRCLRQPVHKIRLIYKSYYGENRRNWKFLCYRNSYNILHNILHKILHKTGVRVSMGAFTFLKFPFLSNFSILTLINSSYFVDGPLVSAYECWGPHSQWTTSLIIIQTSLKKWSTRWMTTTPDALSSRSFCCSCLGRWEIPEWKRRSRFGNFVWFTRFMLSYQSNWYILCTLLDNREGDK